MEALLTLEKLIENFEKKFENTPISNIFESFLTRRIIHKNTFIRWKETVNKEFIESLNLNSFF